VSSPIVIYIDAPGRGGSEKYAIVVAAGLVRRGHRVAALCHSADVMAPMREALERAGVEVHAVEDADRSISTRARRLLRCVRIIRQYPGCDFLMLMGQYTSGGLMTLAGTLGRARRRVRADLQPPMPPYSWKKRLALRLKDRLIDRVVVGAAQNKDDFVRVTGRDHAKIEVIHTGIDLSEFHAEERSATTDRGPVVGTISRLSEKRKGLDTFIDMAAIVARSVPNATFVIAGDGDLRVTLERQAAALGLADRFTFAGWRHDVANVLAEMDVFVLASLFEGGPTTVLEAMAMGLPVVATRVGMVPEVIDPWITGVVVEPGDTEQMASAVTALLTDDRRRTEMGRRASHEAVRSFSADRMVDRYAAILAGTPSTSPP
jgi:glycosyltransferase involved in cell wall biosynthesis